MPIIPLAALVALDVHRRQPAELVVPDIAGRELPGRERGYPTAALGNITQKPAGGLEIAVLAHRFGDQFTGQRRLDRGSGAAGLSPQGLALLHRAANRAELASGPVAAGKIVAGEGLIGSSRNR